MKKFTLILAIIGMITLGSCSSDDKDTDTIGVTWEFSNNINYVSANNYRVTLNFPFQIYTSDMVLMYRLAGVENGQDVWKQMPQTFYFNDGTLDFRYDFEFTTLKATTYLDGFDLEGISTDFRTNQVLRVVVVPAAFGKTSKVDLSDYKAVVKAFKIDESKILKVD